MKLLSVNTARVLWLFSTGESNPRGKYIYSLIAGLIERYKFRDIPNISEALKANQGLKLGDGLYIDPEYGEVQVTFSIFRDGLVGETRADTAVTERFLDDLMEWAVSDFGLKPPVFSRRQFSSELYVHTKRNLTSLNPKLDRFCKLLSEKSEAFGKVKYELSSLAFLAQQVSPAAPVAFRFERDASSPFDSCRYYSHASLTTQEHLNLLDELENIFKA